MTELEKVKKNIYEGVSLDALFEELAEKYDRLVSEIRLCKMTGTDDAKPFAEKAVELGKDTAFCINAVANRIAPTPPLTPFFVAALGYVGDSIAANLGEGGVEVVEALEEYIRATITSVNVGRSAFEAFAGLKDKPDGEEDRQ